jgi:hypothetical protein
VSLYCAFDLGFVRDASAGAIVDRDGDRYRLVAHLEQRPSKGAPLVPEAVCEAIASMCERHGCATAYGDGHYAELARSILGKRGISFTLAPAGNTGKLAVWSKAKELILGGKVRTPNLPGLLAQLKLVRSKAQSGGGVSIEQPRKAGTHGDLAAAFALALWAASEHPEWPKGPLYFRAPDPRHDDMSRSSSSSFMWHADEWEDD